MMRSIQDYSEYHVKENASEQANGDPNALSIVYEVMRRWDKVLSVYELLNGACAVVKAAK